MRAVATLEIRDGDKLNEVHALALGRMIATRLSTGILKKGQARVELHISRGAKSTADRRDMLCDWLEEQGLKLIVDRREYNGIYKAKLYQ